jgi:hypothetical protein
VLRAEGWGKYKDVFPITVRQLIMGFDVASLHGAQLTVINLLQKFPAIYGQRFITVLTRSGYWTLTWLNASCPGLSKVATPFR